MASDANLTIHLVRTGEDFLNKPSYWFGRSSDDIWSFEPVTVPCGLLQLVRESGLEDDMLEIGLSLTISNKSTNGEFVRADLMLELNDEEEIKTLAVYSLNTLDAPSSLVFSFPIGSKHVPRVLWVHARPLDETVLAGVLGDKPGDVWISNAFFHLKQTTLWEFGDTGFESFRHSINWDDVHGIFQRNRELILPGVNQT